MCLVHSMRYRPGLTHVGNIPLELLQCLLAIRKFLEWTMTYLYMFILFCSSVGRGSIGVSVLRPFEYVYGIELKA